MSFTFGGATTTTGSTFGTTTPSTGFSFGGGDARPLFGSTATENKPAFNFSSSTTSAPALPSFSFGPKTATTTAASSLFAPATTTQSAFGASKPLSFGFTSPPNQTVGSPGFGQTPAQNAGQNLSFGGAQTQSTPAPAFGSPVTQAAAPAFGSGSFSFGGAAATPAVPAAPAPATTSNFSFATPTSGFSAPQPTAAVTAAAPAGQGAPPAFGQTPAFQKPSTFSFGSTSTPAFGAATTTSAPAPAFGSTTAPATGGFLQAGPGAPSSLPSFAPAAGAPPAFGAPPGAGMFAPKPPGASALGTSPQPQAQTGLTQSFPSAASFTGATTTQMTTGAPPTYGTSSATELFGRKVSAGLGTTTNEGFSSMGAAPSTQAQVDLTQTHSFPNAASFTAASTASAAPSFGAGQPLSFGTSPAKTTSVLSFGTTTSTPASTAPLSFGGGGIVSTPLSTALSFPAAVSSAAGSLATSQAPQLSQLPQASQASQAAAPPVSGLSFAATSTATSLPAFGTSTIGFGAKTTATTAVSSAAAPTSSAPGALTLGAATSTTLPSLATVTTTTAAGPPAMVSALSFAALEESINKWTLELEEQERTFINQATQINAWDRLLVANGEKITELNEAVQTVKNEQQSLEHELDFVLAQQKELEELLAPLEKQLLDNPGERVKDPEREHMYSLAENLDTQLRQMSEDLKEVIEHLNETNRSQDSNDPIVQIGRILNAHMSSMQWVDSSIAQISTKLDALKHTHDALRRDNERSFQLTYN